MPDLNQLKDLTKQFIEGTISEEEMRQQLKTETNTDERVNVFDCLTRLAQSQ